MQDSNVNYNKIDSESSRMTLGQDNGGDENFRLNIIDNICLKITRKIYVLFH